MKANMYAHVGGAMAVLLCSSSALAQASVFEVGPYLSQLTSRSVVVRVETDTAEALTVTAEPGKLKVTDKSAKGVHSLTLDGLVPKTTYRYAVTTDHGGNEEGTFTTAPDGDLGDIRFILYGDDRGDLGTHKAIVKRMQDEPADFLVNTGDLVADGRSVAQWKTFFDIEASLLRDRCLFATIGNHDFIQESGASYLGYFGTPEEQQSHKFNTTFRWSFARFFLLNGEESFDGDDRKWLERELAAADAEDGVAWRIVVIHDGPFASGLHGDNDRLQNAQLPKLLHDHHVDFVLEGHDHIYERGVSDGMRYIVSGGAGAPLYPIRHLRKTARKVESVHHYVMFDLGHDKGRIVTKRVDGSVLEEVGFSKTSFWDDDLPNAPGVVAPPDSSGTAPPSGPASKPDEEKRQSSYEVPYAALGAVVVAGLWFWITRRRKNTLAP